MELNKIYLGNAYELIKQVPSKSVDLIITDPPYEMSTGGTGKTELAIRFKDRYKELADKKLDVGMDFAILNEMERVCRYIYRYGAIKTCYSNWLTIIPQEMTFYSI